MIQTVQMFIYRYRSVSNNLFFQFVRPVKYDFFVLNVVGWIDTRRAFRLLGTDVDDIDADVFNCRTIDFT